MKSPGPAEQQIQQRVRNYAQSRIALLVTTALGPLTSSRLQQSVYGGTYGRVYFFAEEAIWRMIVRTSPSAGNLPKAFFE